MKSSVALVVFLRRTAGFFTFPVKVPLESSKTAGFFTFPVSFRVICGVLFGISPGGKWKGGEYLTGNVKKPAVFALKGIYFDGKRGETSR